MSTFGYVDGTLHAERTSLAAVAEDVGTPFYCYSAGAIRAAYRDYIEALSGLNASVHYALKANSNLAIIRTLGALGAGADVVSLGELRRARAAGIPGNRIVFSGVGKTADEIGAALDENIEQFNVESESELRLLLDLSQTKGQRPRIALRVNPDVDAGTHAKITTGRRENKFGIDMDRVPALFALAAEAGQPPVGLAVHIGSQLTNLAPYEAAFGHLAELVLELRGLGHKIDRLDLGGGLGIPYRDEPSPDLHTYAAIVGQTVGELGCELMFEPGRFLVGRAGALIAKVIYLKRGNERQIVVIDAAMNDLLRPTLYDAWHDIVPLRAPGNGGARMIADVVGPICETGDTFATGRDLPALAEGEMIAFTCVGAYGAVMASTYNTRPLTPEVLIDDRRYAVVRQRQTIEDLLAQDTIPAWLDGKDGSHENA